ncbi:hypothetical protein RchiOBHm_Chr4g0426941 [Rosa chinensis]|uniref:RNase H type-1 domain-containing protein n=1 Tax=Rosa chinensis TaxID=74649 RepID=A0A2P6QZJ4_ROSCH|nr:hypothetical protein RchiOBHm_Chr4g0426941 [Rosa chinensis]
MDWNELFIIVCWHIWKWRNKGIFEANFTFPHNPKEIIFQYATEISNASKPSIDNRPHQIVTLHWEKPARNNFKLNVDGSRSYAGVIGAGGLIRNSSGVWIKGFSHSMGVGEIVEAEAWGLFIGLKLAFGLHIKDWKLKVIQPLW